MESYSEEDERRLLSFVTGSDRVPIKGLGALVPPFALVKNGDEDRLPTAHTCFNVFMMPAFKVWLNEKCKDHHHAVRISINILHLSNATDLRMAFPYSTAPC